MKALVAAIYQHTAPSGVWINSDVCGPEDGDRVVVLQFHEPGLGHASLDIGSMSPAEVTGYLESLTPAGRFRQFARDFSHLAHASYECEVIDDRRVRLALRDAMEFLAKAAYTDNWLSECHERFCALDWTSWQKIVEAAGFTVDPRSGPYRNDWLVTNRFAAIGHLTDDGGDPVPWPETHILLVARRRGPSSWTNA